MAAKNGRIAAHLLDAKEMTRGSAKLKFQTVLEKLSDSSGWHIVCVPRERAARLDLTGRSRRVVCTLNGSETFQCGLMPYSGGYFIMVNKEVRTRLGIVPGSRLSVEIVRDESRYGAPMPAEFREILDQDPDGERLFHGLTPGKQRGMLYFLSRPKDIDRRIHLGLVFIEHLRQNDGKIVHDALMREMRRPLADPFTDHND